MSEGARVRVLNPGVPYYVQDQRAGNRVDAATAEARMVSFFITLFRFLRAIARGVRDPEFRALFVLLLFVLLSGTIFYSTMEGWSVIDSIYFSVITLTTIGYGDLHPTTPMSKVFTIVYIFVGIGIIMIFIERLATHSLRRGSHHKASAEPGAAVEGKESRAEK